MTSSSINFTSTLEGEVGAEGAGKSVEQIILLNPLPQPFPSRGEGALQRLRTAS